MSSNRAHSLFRTATFRLAARHAALFSVLWVVTFVLVYLAFQAKLTHRADDELREDVRESEGRLLAVPAAERVVTFRDDFDPAEASREFRVLFDAGGEIRTTSEIRPWRGVALAVDGMRVMRPGQEALRTVHAPALEADARVIVRRTRDGGFIEFGSSLADNDELLEVVRRIFVLGWFLTLIPGLLLGWFMARRAMAGVDRVTETAVHIGRSDLSRRVPVGHEGEEIESLARAVNEMLDRIALLVRELGDVTSNIAHDLKTPIARIRATAEHAVQPSLRPGPAQASDGTSARAGRVVTGDGAPADGLPAGSIIEECDRLAAMIDTILEIAATEGGVSALAWSAVDLGAVARDAVELFQPVAEDKGVRLTITLPPEPLFVRGDLGRAQRVVANLLDNAIKYTDSGGWVAVSAATVEDRASLTIADSGIGIDNESLGRVFERFYRGDPSRSTRGHGLGLSLARSIVRAYGGEIVARSEPGRGSAFAILWPSWSTALERRGKADGSGQPDRFVTNLTKR